MEIQRNKYKYGINTAELMKTNHPPPQKHQNLYTDIHQTHRKVSEDLENGTQKVDEVHQVSGGTAVGLSHVPFIVCQLDELIDFLVKLGVNFSLCSMTSILKNKQTKKLYSASKFNFT